METKQCKKCGQVKPVTEFYKAGMQNGVQRYRTQCAACTLTPRTAERWALRGRGLKRCTQCGEMKPITDFYKMGFERGVQEYHCECIACTLSPATAQRLSLREQGLKKCTHCGQVLPLDDFYKDKRCADGRRAVCKSCHIATTTVYRQTRGHAKLQEARRIRNQRPDNKRKRAEYMRKQRVSAAWADQEAARRAVRAAVASGAMPPARNMQCADCGSKAQEYHHASYERDRWLDVTPLCIDCHNKRHVVNA